MAETSLRHDAETGRRPFENSFVVGFTRVPPELPRSVRVQRRLCSCGEMLKPRGCSQGQWGRFVWLLPWTLARTYEELKLESKQYFAGGSTRASTAPLPFGGERGSLAWFCSLAELKVKDGLDLLDREAIESGADPPHVARQT